jgi:hypothetical protein
MGQHWFLSGSEDDAIAGYFVTKPKKIPTPQLRPQKPPIFSIIYPEEDDKFSLACI